MLKPRLPIMGSLSRGCLLALASLSVNACQAVPAMGEKPSTTTDQSCASLELNAAGISGMRASAKTWIEKRFPLANVDAATAKVARAQLSRGVKTYLIYFGGGNLCGSGGCSAMVLAAKPTTRASTDNFEVIGYFSGVHLPIYSSEVEHQGWKDLIVEASGGGIKKPQYKVLAYDSGYFGGLAGNVTDDVVSSASMLIGDSSVSAGCSL